MKKFLIVILCILLIAGITVGIIIYNTNQTEASISLKEYFEKLSSQEYEAMYDYVITDTSKEDFVTRIKNIYEGIEAENITTTVLTNIKNEDNSNIINVTYNNSMDTIAGNMSFMNTVKLQKQDDGYKILWDSSVIFPDLKDEYKVRVTTLDSTRGAIYDRNDIAIAKDGEANSVGLVPGKMDGTTNLTRLAELLNITEDTIKNALSASYVKEDTFVPLRKISKDEKKKKNQLLQIKGVLITDINARIYPYKEATSILTGYVQDDEGKTGMEYAYNDRLKGEDGAEIYITDVNENKIKTLATKEVKNGDNIKTTIDVNIQQKLYNEFKNDEGASVAMNYNNGEILALVSTPSYDANDMTLGVTDTEWNNLQNDEKKPMFNRYLATYVPGSSLKPVVGAIGLKYSSFTQDDDFEASGTRWQNNSSWGELYITTLETYSGPANLRNALIYSDNIYFAKAALKIGRTNLQQGLDDFGFNEKISFVQDISQSTYGSMDSEAAIANSGYGQDQMLVNPIHMAMIYSSFANGGNMVMPVLERAENNNSTNIINGTNTSNNLRGSSNSLSNNTSAQYYKENVISSEIANIIKQDLIAVVEEGTGKAAKVDGKIIAGKTGTAEIKADQKDEEGTEIGWFNAFNEDGLLVVSMCENVKDKGGSHYLLPKVKTVFE